MLNVYYVYWGCVSKQLMRQEHLAMALVADMDKPTSVLKALRDELEKAAEDNQAWPTHHKLDTELECL